MYTFHLMCQYNQLERFCYIHHHYIELFNDDFARKLVQLNYTNSINETVQNISVNLFTQFYNSAKSYTYVRVESISFNGIGGFDSRAQTVLKGSDLQTYSYRFFAAITVLGNPSGISLSAMSYEYPTSTLTFYQAAINSNKIISYYQDMAARTFATRLQHSIVYQKIRD